MDSDLLTKDELRDLVKPLSTINYNELPNIIVARIMRKKLVANGMDDSFVVDFVLPFIKFNVCEKFVKDKDFSEELVGYMADSVSSLYSYIKPEFGDEFFKVYVCSQDFSFSVPDYDD
jgi:hypothetical protein